MKPALQIQSCNSTTADQPRRANQRVTVMGRNSTARAPTTVGSMPTVGPAWPPVGVLDDQAAREVFSAVVFDISAAKLAKSMRVSKECARLYKGAKKFPGGKRLIHGARNEPVIRAWLYHEVERSDEGFESDRALTGTVDQLLKLAAQPGRKGDEARALLAEAHRLMAKGGQ